MSVGERLVVGLVRGITGLRGAVRVEILTDRPEERFAKGQHLFREGSDEPLTVLAAQPDGPGWRIRFVELPDRTAAEVLRDAYLEAVVAPTEVLPRGEYYWHEMLGAAVKDVDGTDLGTVRDVYRAGGAEVLLVRGGPYGELDVPAVRSVVRIFAPRRGEIVVDGEALGIRGQDGEPAPARPPRRPRRRSSPPETPPAESDGPAGDGTGRDAIDDQPSSSG